MPRKIRSLSFVALGVLLSNCDLSLTPQAIPVLSNANGATAPAGPAGSQLVLSGAGFGSSQGSGQVVFSPAGGGLSLTGVIAQPGDWTQSSIVTTVPGGVPGAYAVSVLTGSGIGSGGLFFTLTPATNFAPSAVTWSAGPALPSAISGAGVAFAQVGTAGYVYAVGGAGAGGAPVATVLYAAVQADGTIGAWTTNPTSLPVALEFPAVVAATQLNSAVITNGFVYVLGGATNATGTPVSTVYRAAINNDGSLGSWTSITGLPAAVRSAGAIVQYGSLYVVGGATASVALATAYRSPVQVDGSLSWKTELSLPAPRARFGIGALGLYLYVVGGDSVAVPPNDTGPITAHTNTVFFAKLAPSTRDIATAWTPTAALPAARSALSAVFGSGSVLITGGQYAGALGHTNESLYTAFLGDGTTGSFATAGGTSIYSACGCNLFNNGGTGYLAGNGSFHVLIVGGDDVSALGTRRTETFIY